VLLKRAERGANISPRPSTDAPTSLTERLPVFLTDSVSDASSPLR
jgi:hypothetical protein